MNIFILSLDPVDAAKYHCDKHVIKMILETTQLLYMCWEACGAAGWRQSIEEQLVESTTLKKMETAGQKINYNAYKCGKGHMNHPCSKWLRESRENYIWLIKLGLALCEEKMHRWPKNKPHACLGHLEVLSRNIPDSMPTTPLTSFALAMPIDYKSESVTDSYQTYYNKNKQNLFKWTNRPTPEWIFSDI